MKKWVMLLLCAGLFLSAAACGTAESAHTGSTEAYPRVYERDGSLVVELEGNPTTGYEWTCDPAAGCLAGGEREYTAYPATELEAGTGGVFSFCFEPLAAGEQTLRFAYRRTWEEGSTIDEYNLTVTVRESAAGFALSWE